MTLLEAYKKMYFIRTAEQQIAELYLKEKIMSFVHFYVGQEAVAVGVCNALVHDDRVMGTHRSHGHYLAKGGNLRAMVCELLGKAPGSSHGKGGSMHVIDRAVNFTGSTPILGSIVPLATGSAFEQRYHTSDNVTAVFYGDGASEEGVVYESYNLAALFNLPILYVIENNLYSVNTKIKDRRSSKYDIEKVVTGLGLTYMKADGNDYEDVANKSSALVEQIRAGKGPAVLECVAYRHMAHSAPLMDDAQGYREEDVLEVRLEKDSLARLRSKLIADGVLGDKALGIEEESLRTQVQEEIAFALQAPYPTQDTLTTDLYA